MKNPKLLPLLLATGLLAGCSLAQPEAHSATEDPDKFVGVYAVFGKRQPDYNTWEDYGTGESIDTEFGTFQLPSKVLFADYDEETTRWTFPGLEGYSAFATTVDDTTRGADGLQSLGIAYTNSDCTRLSGDIYIEKSDKTYFVTLYEVYETADGRIYTNGNGNSSSAPATSGGGMTSRRTNTTTENGAVVETYEFEVEVNIVPVVPTTRLTLVQYDRNDVELSRESLPLEEAHLAPHADTAWMVVIEEDKEGTLQHTAYEPPEDEDDWTAHNFYLPQPDGTISVQALFFDVPKT